VELAARPTQDLTSQDQRPYRFGSNERTLVTFDETRSAAMDIDGRDRVQRLVTRPVVYVHPNDTLRRVAETLVEESIGAALIRGPHGAIGLVSERDIVRALAEGGEADRITAQEIMAEELVTADPNDELAAAIHRMLDAEIRHLPIIEHGAAAGMISARDALRALLEEAEENAVR
jgi:CBS domain-containing protein